MKLVRKIAKWVLYFLLVPVTYILVALILSRVTIDREVGDPEVAEHIIYLNTNGVHLDIVIPMENLDSLLLSGLKRDSRDRYLSFGWGEENFYLHTPTWADLTFSNAFSALFLRTTTLMHVTRHKRKRLDWIEIKVNDTELSQLNAYIIGTFRLDANGRKLPLESDSYSSRHAFYQAVGSYSCFKTCNSWVNTGFKESGLRSCLWTPFAFGLMNKYR